MRSYLNRCNDHCIVCFTFVTVNKFFYEIAHLTAEQGAMPLPETDFMRQSLILKATEMVTALVLLICLASSSPINGVGVALFIGIFSLFITVFALAVFVTNLQETIASSRPMLFITKREDLRWTAVEYTYCVALVSLNAIGIVQNWKLASELKDKNSAGYIAATVFSTAHMVMFAVNAAFIVRRPWQDESDEYERRPFARRTYEQLPY